MLSERYGILQAGKGWRGISFGEMPQLLEKATLCRVAAYLNCGYAVMKNHQPVAYGVIQTRKSAKKLIRTSDDFASRAARLALELHKIIKKYDIKAIVGELPSGGAKSAAAMRQMAAATSVVASVASILDIPTEYCTPTQTKLAACGSRSASKEDVMLAIRERFNNRNFPKAKAQFEHIADALAAYLALRHDGSLIKLLLRTHGTVTEAQGR